MQLKWHNRALMALLLQLKSNFRTFMRASEQEPQVQDAALAEMKRSATDLYQAIGEACEEGKTVILLSHRGGGRRHEIRTLGPMNPDGITVRYSSQPNATACLSMCALLSAEWIEVEGSA